MTFIAGIAIALLAVACNRTEAPTGQVVATVDGTEITVAELNEEARARGLTITRDRSLRNALVQELIDRKLLLGEAVDQEFDKNPQYLLAKRRADEILLGQQLLAATAQAWTPSQAELDQYIAAHPASFDRRSLITVDAVNVPRSLPESVRRALQMASTVDLMEQQLKAAGATGARVVQSWDSAALPQTWSKVLLSMQPGATFVLPTVTGVITGKITSTVPQPLAKDLRLQTAREALHRDRMDKILRQVLDTRRSAAEIRFHREFQPEAPNS